MWLTKNPLFSILALTVLLSTVITFNAGFVYAQQADNVEGEADDGNVETEGELPVTDSEGVISKGEATDEQGALTLKPHPDANVFFLFTKPSGMGLELPAGNDVHFLVGFANKGKQDFVVESMEASFRYALDFSYHLQNFSNIGYNRLVKPNEEATLAYSLFVSEQFSARPYGFTVNLYYRDTEGKYYSNAVFNETVNIFEIDEGLDGQTFFLYLFMIACLILVVVVIQQFFFAKRRSSSKPKTEVGTVNPNDVDYDWLPESTLQSLNKSPKAAATRQSPRQRKVKKESS